MRGMDIGILTCGFLVAACASGKDTAPSAAPEIQAPADAGAEEPAACAPWEHDGLEPACDFEPGPGNGRSEPPADAIPKPTGVCPGFADGDGCTVQGDALDCTFQPAGEPLRDVSIWMSPSARTTPGPLVLYYFGLLGFPANAVTPLAGFPPEALQRLYDQGGVLVAPTARADRNPVSFARLPWLDALGFDDDAGDFLLADEIVGCAVEKLGIDVKRIHVSGLSAGGWMTSQVAVHRSSYVASIVTFSGGIEDLQGLQDPKNKSRLPCSTVARPTSSALTSRTRRNRE